MNRPVPAPNRRPAVADDRCQIGIGLEANDFSCSVGGESYHDALVTEMSTYVEGDGACGHHFFDAIYDVWFVATQRHVLVRPGIELQYQALERSRLDRDFGESPARHEAIQDRIIGRRAPNENTTR
jgi:hypothetical protein